MIIRARAKKTLWKSSARQLLMRLSPPVDVSLSVSGQHFYTYLVLQPWIDTVQQVEVLSSLKPIESLRLRKAETTWILSLLQQKMLIYICRVRLRLQQREIRRDKLRHMSDGTQGFCAGGRAVCKIRMKVLIHMGYTAESGGFSNHCNRLSQVFRNRTYKARNIRN